MTNECFFSRYNADDGTWSEMSITLPTKMSHQTAMYVGADVCQCCDTIVVQGGGSAKQKQSWIFDTYTLESDLVNGYGHYTSLDGKMALTYNRDGTQWNIQTADKR